MVYSLHKAGFEVYSVDFFGDLDLKPYVKDCIIVSEQIHLDYENSVALYKDYLVNFALDLIDKYPDIDYLLIGSGLDDALKERKLITDEISKKETEIISLNNEVETIKRARNIFNIYDLLNQHNYNTPYSKSLSVFNLDNKHSYFPLILKKKRSSGGINVYKVDNEEQFFYRKHFIHKTDDKAEWIVQEYIEGIPVSCTVISDGNQCQIISVNRQIIGLKLLNPPKEFIYCGNIVPGRILHEDKKKIIEISSFLTQKLHLKGINGFDFVLRDHYPYLMEINPRIPGSIRASEESLGLNLLEQHVNCFNTKNWKNVKTLIAKYRDKIHRFTTKLIYFAPKKVNIDLIPLINKLNFIHDQSKASSEITKGIPVCSILYSAETFSKSYFNALKIANKINELILN